MITNVRVNDVDILVEILIKRNVVISLINLMEIHALILEKMILAYILINAIVRIVNVNLQMVKNATLYVNLLEHMVKNATLVPSA